MTDYTDTDAEHIQLLRRHLPPGTLGAKDIARRPFDGIRSEGFVIVRAEKDPQLVALSMIELLQRNGYEIRRDSVHGDAPSGSIVQLTCGGVEAGQL